MMTGESVIKANKLVLVPVVGLERIGIKKTSGMSATFTLKSGATYYANAPSKPSSDLDTCDLDKHVASAYFWVKQTHKAGEANLVERHITTNGIQIPVLKPCGIEATYQAGTLCACN